MSDDNFIIWNTHKDTKDMIWISNLVCLKFEDGRWNPYKRENKDMQWKKVS